ncbi:MAG: MMPL family transporter, partial [Myxococcales bacterium]|nr:MMPL family transporter [Myxococcales bacterium]
MADDTPESQPGGARSPEERPTPAQAGRGEGGDLPRLSRLLASLAAFCHRRAPLVLALALALVGASYFGAKRLSLDTDLTKLLPRSFESVRNLDVLAERAFGVGYVTVVASGSEREELERFARDFAPKLEALPSIQYVDYRRPIDFFRDHALYYLELEDLESLRDQLADRYLWEVRKRSPMHDLDLEELGEAPEIDLESLKKKQEGRAGGAGLSLDSDPYLIDPDGKMIVLLARPALRASDVGKAGEVVEEVRRLVDAEDTTPYGGLKLELSGRFQKKADQKRQIEHDLSLSSTLALGLMILYLALHFRRATAVVAVLVPLVVGLAWTFGFAGIAIGRLNLLTGFIGAILLGIGIDHGIHLVGRYHEELARGEPRDTALRLTFADSGRAALLAAATTVFAFVGVAMSEFRAFREFGILAGVGSSLILVAYATVLPALLTYLGAPKKAAEKPKEKGADDQEAPSAIARLLPRWAPVGFWISALLAVWAMTFLDRTRFDYDFASLEDSRLPSFKLDKEVNRLLGRSQTPLLALGDNPEQEVAIAKALRERQKELGDASGIQMVVALGDLVPPKQTEKAAVLAEMRETLESIKPEWLDEEKAKGRADLLRMTQQKPFGRDGLPVEITRQFRGAASESGFVLIYPSISLSDGRGVRKLADELAAVRLDGG